MSQFDRGIAVVGLGYIGLPTAAALATRGVTVHGVDVNPATVDAVSRGQVPFIEPDLAMAVSGAVSKGLLTASSDMPKADAYIVAVPTPFRPDRTADLSYIEQAADAISPHLRGGEIVVLESTSPPGTTQYLSDRLARSRPDLVFPSVNGGRVDVSVAHCPERVLPGRIMIEIITNDRVIGGLTPQCSEKAAEIYRIFCQGEISVTDAGNAEMAKLAENAYRDVNLAFANELSHVCDELGLDVWEVLRNANRHPRVQILNPGPGVGGHCIAVDPWFIVAASPNSTPLIRTAREVNDRQPIRIAGQVTKRAKRYVDPVIACLGLAFKANIDDLRESPSVEVVTRIAGDMPDARILVSEPHIQSLPIGLAEFPNIALAAAQQAVDEADIVVLLVDHNAFGAIRRRSLTGKSVFDTRGYWR